MLQVRSLTKYFVGVLSVASVSAIGLVLLRRRRQRRRRIISPKKVEGSKLKPPRLPNGSYDVIIVGAGPAGSTLAYFLAKKKKTLEILLLERQKFPRVKYCGDAWCAPALDILEQMEWNDGRSVLEELELRGLCRPVKRGGFVSPYGHVCINSDSTNSEYGSEKSVRTYAMKRVFADEFLARAAQRTGVELREECEAVVDKVVFDKDSCCWHVPIKRSPDLSMVKGRLLVAADGATSYLARHIGLVTTDPDSVCSHRYVQGGTHQFKQDGVMFFNRSILPGYSALFRHSNDDMYLGTYILPGGRATSRCIAAFEAELVQRHPLVRDAFGGKGCEQSQWRVDLPAGENGRLKTAPIRCGGEKRSSSDHFLAVGDAAGQTDPMTGEGIHTAMIAATLAADTIVQMFTVGNFSADAAAVYHERWNDHFGRDFIWSSAGARMIREFPILLDAVCAYGRDFGGQAFLDEFGQIMTGVKPKTAFLHPTLAAPVALYLIRELFWQYVWRRSPFVPPDIGNALVEKLAKKNKKRTNP